MILQTAWDTRLLTRVTVTIALSLCAATTSLAQAPIIQPGAPGAASRQITAEEASNLASLRYTEADVQFMRNMIAHHRQALEMTQLVEERSARDTVRDLAQRIELSQEDEIKQMQEWLQERDLEITDSSAQHDADAADMPGLISDQDLAALEELDGPEFDQRFVKLMIEHHRGAVTMVETLLDQPGTAQDSVMFEFTSEVTSEQESEIERMTSMLAGFFPDPRVGLQAGFRDAGEASLNMTLLTSLPKPDGFFDPENPAGLPMSRVRKTESLAADAADPEEGDGDRIDEIVEDDQEPNEGDVEVAENVDGDANDDLAAEESEEEEGEDEDEESEPRPSLLNFANTDLAFSGDVLIAGNYHGFNAYDISNGKEPQLLSSVVCPGGQGDVSIVDNLLIMSVEQTRGRLDCGLQGVAEPVSTERFRGIRIFDVSDFTMPRQVGAVQTCRGSHTHTVIADPSDPENVYVYISGTSSVRSDEEMEICVDESPYKDPDSARFRIDVIQIPLEQPGEARIVSRPYVFADPDSGVIAGLWEGGDHGDDTQTTNETNHCHDITAFTSLGLAAGACSGNGILFDISDPLNPERLDEVLDPGFAYWHSATFNNDGSKVIFTDEWGGGSRARCRSFDPEDWGADAIYDIVDNKLEFRGYYKLPAPQSEEENCVAHNGSLVPVPGRDIFVQSWYQGGISVVDFSDSTSPVEIAFFDRGPVDEEELVMGGYWSSYWYDGLIYGTEIARGLDVFALTPSEYLTENEIAAASLSFSPDVFNPQQQQRHVWPAEPVVARAYLDQLRRDNAIDAEQGEALTAALDRADSLLESNANSSAGSDTMSELRELASSLAREGESRSGATGSRYLSLASTVEELAERLQ